MNAAGSICNPSSAVFEPPAETVDELRRREPVFQNEPREGGREHLEAIMAPEFFEFGASGRIYSREQIIDRVLARYELNEPEPEVEIEDFRVLQPCEHIFIATYTLHQPDGHLDRVTRRTTIWTDREGHLQVVQHQGTMADPSPA